MKVWYFESKRCHERKRYGSADTVRIDLCTHPPCYDYAVGHIEAGIVMAEDEEMYDRLKLFLNEAAKLYGRIVLGSNVEPLGGDTYGA